MGSKAEEYLRRMRALGYQDSLAGMDDEDIGYELARMDAAERRQNAPQQPLRTVYRAVDPSLQARILRMFGQKYDASAIPKGQEFYLNGWENGDDEAYAAPAVKTGQNYYAAASGQTRQDDWRDGGNSATGGTAAGGGTRNPDWGDGGNSAWRIGGGGTTASGTITEGRTEANDGDDKKELATIAEFKKRYGNMIIEKAKDLGVDPDLLGATIWVESSGSGFSNGKMKIRFENHHFIDKSGQDYGLFTGEEYDSPHNYRANVNDNWKPVHTEHNDDEHAAFEVAKRLNKDAAYKSISMGLGQVMGFNHSAAGYNSAQEMYDDFSRGHTPQINGMVSFIRNDKNGALLKDLQNNNLRGFVEKYNGAGNVDDYLEKLHNGITSYRSN